MRKLTIRVGAAIFALATIVIIGLVVLSVMETRPANLGVSDQKLRSCNEADNCVCSEYPETPNTMAPIPFKGSSEDAMKRLAEIVSAMPRSKVVEQTEDYLHVEFRSLIFRFTDDVEFRVDEQSDVVHFRSASRIGKSDLGVNRHRMQQISNAFTAAEGD